MTTYTYKDRTLTRESYFKTRRKLDISSAGIEFKLAAPSTSTRIWHIIMEQKIIAPRHCQYSWLFLLYIRTINSTFLVAVQFDEVWGGGIFTLYPGWLAATHCFENGKYCNIESMCRSKKSLFSKLFLHSAQKVFQKIFWL